MKMNIVKWDPSMAKRCAERLQRSFRPGPALQNESPNKSAQGGEWGNFELKMDKEKVKKVSKPVYEQSGESFSLPMQTGEWDDFKTRVHRATRR